MAGARKGDIRIFVDGIGSVAALSTVTVRSQIDGQLLSVNFKEGQNVSKGSLLAIIDPRPFEAQQAQAAGQLQRDQALLANARQDLERYDTLWSQNAIARQQYDTQKSLVAQLEGTVMIDQGALANAKLQVAYTRITSPINGRVGLKFVDAGNIVHSTDANGLAVVTQLQPITVVFTIAEDNLPPVLEKFKKPEGLSVLAFNRSDSVKIAEGRLLAVDNRIDTATGTVRLKAVFPNTDNELYPNQFVNARLLLDVKHDAVIIPQAALQRGPQSTFVYLVKQDHTVSVVPVAAGLTEKDNISIDTGLVVGDTVVVEGADRLREGSIVESIAPTGPAAGRPEHSSRGAHSAGGKKQ
jgi:multidrug efflux system membrane fusion protein